MLGTVLLVVLVLLVVEPYPHGLTAVIGATTRAADWDSCWSFCLFWYF